MCYHDQLLLVDDDMDLLKVYKKIFKLNGFDVITASDSFKALEIIKTEPIGVVVSDIIMPRMDGMGLLQKIREVNSSIQVIMLTAEGSVSGAVEAVRAGAFTYMMKPADIDELLFNVQRSFELYHLKNENLILKQQMLEKAGLEILIGTNGKIKEIRDTVHTIAATDAAVLITGESGTGKEIIANMVHYGSNRAEKSFVRVNCAVLTESLLESELFGHEKGAFTGADRMHRGKFETADGGSILLDEIGELSLNTQAKLLRVLQEKEFERVGGSSTIKTNFRLIASTNKNLKEEVGKRKFRDDLFYRINVVPISLPPLRERKDDIPILAKYFLMQLSEEMNRGITFLPAEIIEVLVSYHWPGNVRELKNIIERLVVMAKNSEISISDVPDELKAHMLNENNGNTTLVAARKNFEKQYIIDALRRNNDHVGKTSIQLGIARKNLYKKIKEFNINSNNQSL